MTQPSRVIYLPPGMMPAPAQAAPQGAGGVPFDRVFFEQVLPAAVDAFCRQVKCDVPVVELLTVDGTIHYVNGVSGIADNWVALHTSQREHPHPMQAFIPYQTIFRVEIHPQSDLREHRLGFITMPDGDAEPDGPTGWRKR